MSMQPLPRRPIRVAKGLINLPFVRRVMLTGSYAESTARPDSDIDLFIQVVPGRLYVARLIVTLWVLSLGVRRTDTQIAKRLCLNWFAAYNAPQRQHRVAKELASRTKTNRLEHWLSARLGDQFEAWARDFQVRRFARDERTYRPGSEVRWSDTELGFHPHTPKRR